MRAVYRLLFHLERDGVKVAPLNVVPIGTTEHLRDRSSLCFLSSSSVTSCPRHNRQSAIFHIPIIGRRHLARTSVSLTPPLMTDFAPGLRHHILMEYLPQLSCSQSSEPNTPMWHRAWELN
jgi:hypothetical protein